MLQFLVAEGDPQLAGVLGAALADELGAEIIHARTGATATDMLQTRPADMAVIGVLLPDMSGFKLAEYAASSSLPVFLFSGHPQAQAICKAYGYPHIELPCPIAEMAGVARAILREQQSNIRTLHRCYARLQSTLDRASRAAGRYGPVGLESRGIFAEKLLRLQRLTMSDRTIERLVVIENVYRYERLLHNELRLRHDTPARRTLERLLHAEQAYLAALDDWERMVGALKHCA